MSSLDQKIRSVKQWLWLKGRKGIHPNADEIWKHIQEKWPQLETPEHERIFQFSK